MSQLKVRSRSVTVNQPYESNSPTMSQTMPAKPTQTVRDFSKW